MSDLYSFIISENRLEIVEDAGEILSAKYTGAELKKILNMIEKSDPYDDKRFAVNIANWILDEDRGDIGGYFDDELETYSSMIKDYKESMRKMKSMWMNVSNSAIKSKMKDFMSIDIEDFKNIQYMQECLDTAEKLTDKDYVYSDSCVELVGTHGEYKMYEINSFDDLECEIVDFLMPWCVVKSEHYGSYGGPPYFPIMKGQEPVGIFCSKNISVGYDNDTFRNANNTGAMSKETIDKVLPLLRLAHPKFEKTSNISLYIHFESAGYKLLRIFGSWLYYPLTDEGEEWVEKAFEISKMDDDESSSEMWDDHSIELEKIGGIFLD
jgi:hypothetical protein